MTKTKIIRVTMTVDYYLDMATDTVSEMNGWTPEQVIQYWFKEFDINRYHASRDNIQIGNSKKVLDIQLLNVEDI